MTAIVSAVIVVAALVAGLAWAFRPTPRLIPIPVRTRARRRQQD